VSDELERIWKKAVVPKSKYYPGICPENLKKTTYNLSQYNPHHGPDSIQAPPDDQFRDLPRHHPVRLVIVVVVVIVVFRRILKSITDFIAIGET
jgi:hypothetical protein